MYGPSLPSGLAGTTLPGPRYAARPLMTPEPSAVTQTAPGTQKALYGLIPKAEQKVYGNIPLWEVEGHQVDPAYDVRVGSGLGEPLSQDVNVAAPGNDTFDFRRMLLPILAGVAVWYLVSVGKVRRNPRSNKHGRSYAGRGKYALVRG